MNTDRQLVLDFEHRPSLTGDDFLVSDCNREAIDWIDSWPDWPSPALVIIGAPGAGKSHLAAVFAGRSNALQVTADAFSEAASDVEEDLVVEDVDQVLAEAYEEPLLHLYNAAKESGHRLLLTARTPPVRWGIKLADLRSRMNAALTVEIGPPEDSLIAALLVKMFADRQVQVSHDVISYAISRMERSFPAARLVVEKADELALREKKRITVPLIKRVLEAVEQEEDNGLRHSG